MFSKILFFVTISAGLLFSQQLPKNIIILIGDGMGLSHVSANVIQDKDNPFQKFTSIGLSLTSSADNLITDSGAGATAISTGYRTYNTAIAFSTDRKPLTTIMQLAEKLKKSTGIIATSSVTNATPAAFVANQPERKMENQIAYDIFRSGADVVIGGGSSYFTGKDRGGRRANGDHLLDSLVAQGYRYFSNYNDLMRYEDKKPFYALLEKDALAKAGDRNYNLGNLVVKAIEVLSQDNEGFILMIEGSQIDWAAHDKNTGQVFREMSDFSSAVKAALSFADKDKNTLVLVTSDHETGGVSINKGDLGGSDLELEFTTGSHTADMVGIFSKGPGEERFRGVIANFMIGRKLFWLLDPVYKFN